MGFTGRGRRRAHAADGGGRRPARNVGRTAAAVRFWTGRGLAAVGLAAGDVVTERQAELPLGEGRHPDADQIGRERLDAGKSPAEARRATVLGRPVEHNRSERTGRRRNGRPGWRD
ncbi:hypothetical protein ACFVYV_40645 [Streptomyces mirabilis]|uniref:hypothetical protein n=1 Tax=Streptomyces TaxID=1883 RepID=UPI00359C1ADA